MMGFFEPNKLEKNNKAIINKWIIAAASFVLVSCGTPERLDPDINVEKSKSIVEERILAPLSTDNNSLAQLPTMPPRRQLLQLRYNVNSLSNPEFINTLERLSSIYTGTNKSNSFDEVALPSSITAVSFDPAEDPFQNIKDTLAEEEEVPSPVYEPVGEDERNRIIKIRSDRRKDIIIREGLRLEQDLFTKLRETDETFATAGQNLEATLFAQLKTVEDQIKTYEDNRIPGVGESPPERVFGRDLTRDRDGYFAIPPDLALMGSANDGAVSSKIGALRGHVDNPVIQISFNNLSLADAIRFVSATIDLQVLLSNEVENSEQVVTLNVEAGVLSVLDAMLSQYDISILYDQDLEVAQLYSDTEFEDRLNRVRQAVESYNQALYERRETVKLMQQRDLLDELIDVTRSIVYNYETEIATVYSSEDVDQLITLIPKNDDTFSKPLAEKRALEELQRDKNRLLEMITIVQSLLSGNVERFFEEIDQIDRTPGNEVIAVTLNELTLSRLQLDEVLQSYDAETERSLQDRLVEPAVIVKKKPATKKVQKFTASINNVPGFKNLAVNDPCIFDDREVFTEKIAVYGGTGAVERIDNILQGYFTDARSAFQVVDEPEEENEAEEQAADEGQEEAPAQDNANNAEEGEEEGTSGSSLLSNIDISADDLIPDAPDPFKIIEEGDDEDEDKRPAGCGEDPAKASPDFVKANDDSGFIVTGLMNDIELFVRLVEEFDRPQRQVLIEVFMISVIKNFNRRLDLSFTTDALAGNLSDTDGFFLRRDLESLATTVQPDLPGGFVSGLISPNLQVQALVDFIETNNLGRTISSPTILVEEGNSASVSRTLSKNINVASREVRDNQTQTNYETQSADATFKLSVTDVTVNPNNKNVLLDFSLEDTTFSEPLAAVDENTGTISDVIQTKFQAAPGDVIVLAGLFKQNDSTDAIGLPGTTTTGLPTSFLTGGVDNVANNVEEMIILMAPTVIEPEIGKLSPNSALTRTLGSKVKVGDQ